MCLFNNIINSEARRSDDIQSGSDQPDDNRISGDWHRTQHGLARQNRQQGAAGEDRFYKYHLFDLISFVSCATANECNYMTPLGRTNWRRSDQLPAF